MKNPMIENNINAELFEAIDENNVNGGSIIHSMGRINVCYGQTNHGVHCGITAVPSLVCIVTPVMTIKPNCYKEK